MINNCVLFKLNAVLFERVQADLLDEPIEIVSLLAEIAVVWRYRLGCFPLPPP